LEGFVNSRYAYVVDVISVFAYHCSLRSPGLYHIAFLYPTRRDLAEIVQRLIDAGYPITGASDHGVSEAIYLNDPDGNGVELYCDRPREAWSYEADGSVKMVTLPLDLDALLGSL
jgi:catechol 2,3-dioxygenase